jgi:hypothetical protein
MDITLRVSITRNNVPALIWSPAYIEHIMNKYQVALRKMSDSVYFVNSNNSYLCNKLGKVIFFLTRCGIFNRDEVEIKNASSTEKTLFLRIAHMIFSTGVWKIHKIWIF